LAIHVPPTPSASSTSGPTQQSDAPTAAAAPAISEVFALSLAIFTLLDLSSDFNLNSVVWYGLKGELMQRAMTIGRLAETAGVGVETIRYYQRRGLLDEPRKPFRGHRHYPADMAKHVRFIKRAQALGFTLEEIASLLRLDGADCCSDTRELAAHKVFDRGEIARPCGDARRTLGARAPVRDGAGRRVLPDHFRSGAGRMRYSVLSAL
jgi:MerR family mercuric resistance operon transcriptional regulator